MGDWPRATDPVHPLLAEGLPEDWADCAVLKALAALDDADEGAPAQPPALRSHGGRVEKGVAGPRKKRHAAAQPYAARVRETVLALRLWAPVRAAGDADKDAATVGATRCD